MLSELALGGRSAPLSPAAEVQALHGIGQA